MNSQADRIINLTETFRALLEQETRSCQHSVSALLESVRTLQGDTADRRLQSLSGQLKKLHQRLALLEELAHRDFLKPLRQEAEMLRSDQAGSRLATLLTALLDASATSLGAFCELLLDRVIEAVGAERGFILFYSPESTEADVIAARHFDTTHLALREYRFSRTLLREVFERARPLLLEDASHHPDFAKEESIAGLHLKSVLAAPLIEDHRAIGAIYLENNTVPCAFDQEDLDLLEPVSRLALSYLRHYRLLPILFKSSSRVFFDDARASKEIVGRDPSILKLLEVIERLADSPATILIEGESGSGKELVARALHYRSARRDRPFSAICCAAIPENLMESELFGHEKGAFTGASEQYIGRIEQAEGGTIFLDEVGELAYPLQAKLLRFLQSSELQRLGGKETLRVDVRMVAATSKDLKEMVEKGNFQDALYYRLNVIPVHVPALRQRRDDIPLLVDYFLEKFSRLYGRSMSVEREVYDWLREYPFPGNVRELENMIHRMVALATADTLAAEDLPREILQISSQRISLAKDVFHHVLQTPVVDLEDLRNRKRQAKRRFAELERQYTERVIKEAGGNLSEAARRLGMHRVTLHRIIQKSSKRNAV
ncbi:MAG: sigma 54-interacting transcriptional regulator [Acidobacteriia bacterium]|nr:sigma 54-interacting transcriptional regulator [Terriglobia bacterium]